MVRRLSRQHILVLLIATVNSRVPELLGRQSYAHSSAAAMSSDPSASSDTLAFLDGLRKQYAHQPVFLQAVDEMAYSLLDLFKDPDEGAFYKRAFLAMTEPERTISFRVSWTDDQGNMHFNRGWRVQFSSVLGPYKGGLRFHNTVDEGILKFLGFEQIFKNALTGLPMGGGKGGSDFDPHGKSDGEVRRFCQSFMTELVRYIHPSTDVPAGDIGVGGREIGYMYGTYKRLANRHGEGVLTGKGLEWGGSFIRPEATGFGLVYMTKLVLESELKKPMKGLRVAVSGSGNVAQFTARKLIDLQAKVCTMSDSNGVLVFEKGMTEDDWKKVVDLKNNKRGRLSELHDYVSGKYMKGETPWSIDVKYDVALPCATQNEIRREDAERLVSNGVSAVLEGANLPTEAEAQDVLRRAENVVYIPGKASNAGGVGVSGLEMSQNAQRARWTAGEVDNRLQDMMGSIFNSMKEATKNGGSFEQGANRAGFIKVAKAMKDLGWVY